MKFSIIRSAFLEALQSVQNVAGAKNTVTILQNALIEASDNKICITATDLDIAERFYVECKVDKAGSTTIPVRRLTSIIRELEEGNVNVEVDDNDNATVESGSSYFRIKGLPISDFPTVPMAEGTFCYHIDQGIFREMLKKTSFAVSQDEGRRILNGVLLAFKDNKLTMVATDGRRLSLVDNEVEFAPEAESEIILPTKAVVELLRMVNNEGDLKIYVQENLVIFEFDDLIISTKMIEGPYPNYRQVIPTSCDERVSVCRDTLLKAVRRVASISSDKASSIKLIFTANQLVINTMSADVGEARDIVPVKYAGKEISIVFNPEYLMDPLKNLDDDEVFIELSDGHSPALIKCGIPFVYVLMPLRLS